MTLYVCAYVYCITQPRALSRRTGPGQGQVRTRKKGLHRTQYTAPYKPVPSSFQNVRINVTKESARQATAKILGSTGMNEASYLLHEKSLWHLASDSV